MWKCDYFLCDDTICSNLFIDYYLSIDSFEFSAYVGIVFANDSFFSFLIPVPFNSFSYFTISANVQ